MPLEGGKYRYAEGGKVRLHFNDAGEVDEAKSAKTGKVHTPAEFAADKEKAAKKKGERAALDKMAR